MQKTCPVCGEIIRGRSDKKYCSDFCRNAFHNKHNSEKNAYINKVNRILRKNHQILTRLNPKDKTTTHIKKLHQEGFNFDYFTNIYETKSGRVYKFCYDQGFLELDDGYFAIVKREEYV